MKKFLLALGVLLIGGFWYSPSAFAYTIDQAVQSATVVNSCGYASNDTALCGQGFKTVGAGAIDSIVLRLENDGSFSGANVVVDIEGDAVGVPDGTVLGSSDPVDVTTLPAYTGACTGGNTTFTFSTPVSVSASTQYHLVVRTTAYGTPTSAMRWCGAGDVYADGNAAYTTSNTSTWTTLSADAFFSIDVAAGGGGGGTGTTTIQYVDNYNQDTFMIVILYLMSAWGGVWFFRKRN